MKEDEPKEPNPREGANPLSVMLFAWTLSVFSKFNGKSNQELKDLYAPLAEDEAEILGDKLERYLMCIGVSKVIYFHNKNKILLSFITKYFVHNHLHQHKN